ncbi:hypothetical protein ACA910_002537 [Epithemia clementina (nom. ined.)]
MLEAPVLERANRWQDHVDTWIMIERERFPPLFTPNSDDDNSNFTTLVDCLSDDSTLAFTATLDNFGKVSEGDNNISEPDHGVARRAAAMETHRDTIDAQCKKATDFTNIGPLPDMTNWHMDPVPTMDSTIQEMRNLRITLTSSMFNIDAMTNISANKAVLLYGRAEQIRAHPNFQ